MAFRTIRQVAAMGLLSEHRLRIMLKRGELPGVYSGRWFLVNVDALMEQLANATRQGARL